ncbi:MAG TPA: hypothetical protein VD837_04335 [Terriglobales bacterium]|nr:hypothetical protein [Terriglobales bacterium]
MGWVREEYEDRLRSHQGGVNAAERQFEEAAARRWQELVAQIEADIDEYRQHGGAASFTRVSDIEVRVTDSESALAVNVRADLPGHAIHYDFGSRNDRVASPVGGIFSIRQSRSGRTELYSADERVHSEDARRMLLEPILFPNEKAA